MSEDATSGGDVGAEFGCPRCGERDADRLQIDDDEQVRCLACGLNYRIGEPADRAADPGLN